MHYNVQFSDYATQPVRGQVSSGHEYFLYAIFYFSDDP
jgi:hypothetical protein